MKTNCVKIKWMTGQVRPFILPLSLTLILGAVCSLSGIILALLSKLLIDCAATTQVHRMVQYVFIICILILADVGARAVASIMSAQCSTKISNNIQQRLYTHLTQTDWLELSRYHSGDVLTRMTSDVDAVTNLLASILPNIVSLCVMLTGSLIILLVFEPVLAVLVLLIGPVSLLLSRFYGRWLKKLYTQIKEVEANYRSFIHESIQNMVVVKAFGLEQVNFTRISNLQKNKLNLVSHRSRVSAVSNSILILSSWLGYFLVFSWGALNLTKGIATFGTFTALLQLVGYIQGPFSGLAHTLPQVVSAFASAERIIELEELQLDISDTPVVDMNSAGIQFESVSFDYKKNISVLKDVSARIYPGETVALIGSSGEGKTTLIRLLLSLVQPKKGHVHVTNGHEKYAVSASSRKLISYVPQGNTLFSGTIADNLRYGCPDATDRELEAAARAACVWEFIENLTDGLYTVIGERGMGLSEGQAQRLSIARALLRKSPILVLDEATSALDISTEIKVLQSIRSLSPARTCIIITHRLTALKICNRVFKLEDAHLVELQNQITEDPATEAV